MYLIDCHVRNITNPIVDWFRNSWEVLCLLNLMSDISGNNSVQTCYHHQSMWVPTMAPFDESFNWWGPLLPNRPTAPMLHDLQMQALTRKICIFPFRVQTITDHPGPSADEAPTILALHVAGPKLCPVAESRCSPSWLSWFGHCEFVATLRIRPLVPR